MLSLCRFILGRHLHHAQLHTRPKDTLTSLQYDLNTPIYKYIFRIFAFRLCYIIMSRMKRKQVNENKATGKEEADATGKKGSRHLLLVCPLIYITLISYCFGYQMLFYI